MKPRVLLLCRKRSLAAGVRGALKPFGYALGCASQPAALWRALARANGPHVVILSQACLDGAVVELLSALRRDPRGAALCVMLLAADGKESTMLKGFESGADDVLSPPWGYPEMCARLRVMLRRIPGLALDGGGAAVEGIAFSDDEDCLRVGERRIPMTQNERRILRLLLSKPGRTVSRGDLLKTLWNTTEKLRTRCVDVHVSHLRRKLRSSACRILTVRHQGYRLDLA